MTDSPKSGPTSQKQPLRVCSFESRRGVEMARLLERHGAKATVVASLREIPLQDQATVAPFCRQLQEGAVDIVVFLTGVGATTLRDAAKQLGLERQLLDGLQQTTNIVRGPKPAAVLRDWNTPIAGRVREPNTWKELLELIDAEFPVTDRTVAIQEYGQPNPQLERELQQRGARVLGVPVYRWDLPEDLRPLKAAIAATIAGDFDALLFTSAQQVVHVLEVAVAEGRAEQWLHAANRLLVGSIGPTCSQALRTAGLAISVEASPPKMGQLVAQTLAAAERNSD